MANATIEDFKKPVNVDADTQSVDIKNDTVNFVGNVIIKQGSLIIHADELKANAKQGKGKEVFTAKGSPATYEQTLDDGRVITAQADEIIYKRAARHLALKGAAQLKQNDSLVKGDVIEYDLEAQKLDATSQQENKSSRVTTIFTTEDIEAKSVQDKNKTEETNAKDESVNKEAPEESKIETP